MLRGESIEQVDEFVQHADDQLLARLAFAVGDKNGEKVIVLRVRPSRQGPPTLVLGGIGFSSASAAGESVSSVRRPFASAVAPMTSWPGLWPAIPGKSPGSIPAAMADSLPRRCPKPHFRRCMIGSAPMSSVRSRRRLTGVGPGIGSSSISSHSYVVTINPAKKPEPREPKPAAKPKDRPEQNGGR